MSQDHPFLRSSRVALLFFKCNGLNPLEVQPSGAFFEENWQIVEIFQSALKNFQADNYFSNSQNSGQDFVHLRSAKLCFCPPQRIAINEFAE